MYIALMVAVMCVIEMVEFWWGEFYFGYQKGGSTKRGVPHGIRGAGSYFV